MSPIWTSNGRTTPYLRFKAMGFKVGGTLAVEDTAANLDIDLPLAAMMVKGMIEQRVRQEIGTVLALKNEGQACTGDFRAKIREAYLTAGPFPGIKMGITPSAG